MVLVSSYVNAGDAKLENVLTRNSEGNYCYTLANNAFVIMGYRQDGMSKEDLITKINKLDKSYTKKELLQLVNQAYSLPKGNPKGYDQAVVAMNFLSDTESKCMNERSGR